MIGGVTPRQVREALEQLEKRQVFSRTAEGVIYSRRMVRDEHHRNVRAAGGPKALQHPNVPQPRQKRASQDATKDTFPQSFGPSIGGSPASASAFATASANSTDAASAASTPTEMDLKPETGSDKPKPNPIRDLLALYERLFTEKFSAKPAVGAKEAAQLKRLIDSHGAETVADRLRGMYQSADPFICGSSYTIGVLVGCWNKLSIEAALRRPVAQAALFENGRGSTWSAILTKLEMRFDRRTVRDVFARMALVDEAADVVAVREPSAGVAAMIRRRYLSALEEACAAVRPGLSVRLLDVDGMDVAATETGPPRVAGDAGTIQGQHDGA